MFYNKPIFFEQNRVFRVYTGGKLMGKFLGKDFEDDFYPEEWVASAVKALNEKVSDEHEGISKIQDSNLYFDEAIKQYPTEMLGDKKNLSVLVKYLDSAIRLPVQAHPTKEFSKKHFNSPYGKEECWYILDTREGASVCFGFKDGVTEEDFRHAINESETDKNAMEKLLQKYEVKKGDVVYIPAKTVHAIGYGCLILEVQEPTDFTIQPERWCGDYKLSDKEMYMNLDMDSAMECFDFGDTAKPFVIPKIASVGDGIKDEILIGSEQTESFKLNRIIFSGGEYCLSETAVYIIASGSGEIVGADGYKREVKQGDYFFLPANAKDKFTVKGRDLEMLICR